MMFGQQVRAQMHNLDYVEKSHPIRKDTQAALVQRAEDVDAILKERESLFCEQARAACAFDPRWLKGSPKDRRWFQQALGDAEKMVEARSAK